MGEAINDHRFVQRAEAPNDSEVRAESPERLDRKEVQLD
jgi:hypothetical protein